MSKTYRTPVVASLGNAEVLTEVQSGRGKHQEALLGTTTTAAMLDL
jgi:hypothetical protein